MFTYEPLPIQYLDAPGIGPSARNTVGDTDLTFHKE
jgi:hypothetical protein